MHILDLFLRPEITGMTLIFFARILDVSIGTMRIILISRGYKMLAPLLGFFEVIIWLVAMGEVMRHLHSFYGYIIYGAGFATGNYVGMILESKIAIGYQAIRIITSEKIVSLPLVLRQEGYGVTTLKGMGARGEVTVIFTIIPRKKIPQVLEMVEMLEPAAFITIEDVKSTARGFFGDRKGFFESFGNLITKKK
jgi:uncharacterized protein YebE (UPF0316 family)